ncbi:MAG: DUF357 domain-containing protein [Euryarchaeota archaeon]|nr:DUF357 domain-containing protein [Euryarchaeota archaeon]MBU4492438.1 DUF357 domain-containing protein [Euryarchaeota archaeon]MCG2727334.1 DUF357 domain-containing protein [Candidatus Methanoperedenaceae archaeon]
MKTHAVLEEKVKRYEGMLNKALKAFEISPQENSHLRKVADDYSTMASSYYDDGVHFQKDGDMVNAIVCFSYGHAWLDAGVKLGIFKVNDENLFTI